MPAIIRVVDDRTIIQVGENSLAIARQVVEATDAADRSEAQADRSQAASDAARAQVQNLYSTVGEGEAAVGEGDYFAVVNTPANKLYRKVGGSAEFVEYLGEFDFENRAALEAFIGDPLPEGAKVAVRDHPGDGYEVMSSDFPLPDIITAGGDRLREIGRTSTRMVKADWAPGGALPLGMPEDQSWSQTPFVWGYPSIRKTFREASQVGVVGSYGQMRPQVFLKAAHDGYHVFSSGNGNTGQNVALMHYTRDLLNYKDVGKTPLHDTIDAAWQGSRSWITAAGYDENGHALAFMGGNHIANAAEWGERQAGLLFGPSFQELEFANLAEPTITIFTAGIADWAVPGSDKIYARHDIFYNERTGFYYVTVEAGPNNGPYRTGIIVAESLADLKAGIFREPLPGEGWVNPIWKREDLIAQHPTVYDNSWQLTPGQPMQVGDRWHMAFKTGNDGGNANDRYIGFAHAPSRFGPWTYSVPLIESEFALGSAHLLPYGDSWIVVADDRDTERGLMLFRCNGQGKDIIPEGPPAKGPPMSSLYPDEGYGGLRAPFDIRSSAGVANNFRYLLLAKVGDPTHAIVGKIIGRERNSTAAGEQSAEVALNIAQKNAEGGIFWEVLHDNGAAANTALKVVTLTFAGNRWFALDSGIPAPGQAYNFRISSFFGYFTEHPDQLEWVPHSQVTDIRDPLFGRLRPWSPVFEGSTVAGAVTYLSGRSSWHKEGRSVHASALLSITALNTAPEGNLFIKSLPLTAHESWTAEVHVSDWSNLNLPADFSGVFKPRLETTGAGNPRTTTGRIELRYVANDGTGPKSLPATVLAANSTMAISVIYDVKMAT